MEGGAQGAGEGAGAVARQNLQQRLLDAVKQARDERFCRRGESSQHTNCSYSFCSVRSTLERDRRWPQRRTSGN